MPERGFYFVVVSILFFNVENFSQEKAPECIKLPINHNKLSNFDFENLTRLEWPQKDFVNRFQKINGDTIFRKQRPDLFVLSSSFYADHLSFFCRNELKLQKITTVPFRFRIGSLDYVNYLDRKPNARRLF